MSGGAFDYFYAKTAELADKVYEGKSEEERTLARLLYDIADVMYNLEYYRSGDSSFEEFKESWDQFNKKWLKENIGGKNDE